MVEKLNTMQIPFPDFVMYETIDPEEFDANNKVMQDKVNAIIGSLNAFLLDVKNNTPGNSYYTKNELESLIEFGPRTHASLDGGSFFDTYVRPTSVDGGGFEEELSPVFIYDGGEF